MTLMGKIVTQFRQPSGLAGWLAGRIMANRPSNRVRNDWTVSLLELEPGSRVLEWGCGPGLGIGACLESCPTARIVAVDHSPMMVRAAAKRHSRAVAAGRVQVLLGSIEAAESLGPFDTIYSCNVFQFVDDKAATIAKLKECLVEKGIVASTFQPRSGPDRANAARSWAEKVAQLHRSAGFSRVEVRSLAMPDAPAVCVIAHK